MARIESGNDYWDEYDVQAVLQAGGETVYRARAFRKHKSAPDFSPVPTEGYGLTEAQAISEVLNRLTLPAVDVRPSLFR